MRRYSLVQNINGKPIYPMREEKALGLVEEGKAILLSKDPLAIKLNYLPEDVKKKKPKDVKKKKYIVMLEIAGNAAMWTRPDTGDSPISEIVPSYSAVEGIFKSIFWHPAVEIIPLKTEICSPIKYQDYWTNYGGPQRKSDLVKKGNQYQSKATTLVDVCYRMYAEVVPCRDKSKLSKKALEWDAKTTSPAHAYQEIFFRRLEKGQAFHTPFLGWKEFTPSYFGPFRPKTEVLSDFPDIIIPSMLRQVFPDGYDSPVDFTFDNNVWVKDGIVSYTRDAA